MNGAGAIASLLTGFVLGTVRFVLEVLDKSRHFEAAAIRSVIDLNFLHYAIVMFLVCAAVLVVVSLLTPPPDRRALAGLTFATVDEKLETTVVRGPGMPKPPPETGMQHRINIVLSVALVLTVVSLWIYFR